MKYRDVSPTDPDPTEQNVRGTSPEDSDPPPPLPTK
jgi:hypothetical protein